MLSAHSASLPELPAFQMLQATLLLTPLQCDNGNPVPSAADALDRFSATNAQMVQDTCEVVFSRGLQLQREIADRGQFFWLASTDSVYHQPSVNDAVYRDDYRSG